MGQILSHNLKDVLIVVIRYFGGVKLGVSGLIAAYKACSADTLQNADIITVPIEHLYSISLPYDLLNEMMSTLKRINAKITGTVYNNNQVDIEFSVSTDISHNIEDHFQKFNQLSPPKYLKVL